MALCEQIRYGGPGSGAFVGRNEEASCSYERDLDTTIESISWCCEFMKWPYRTPNCTRRQQRKAFALSDCGNRAVQ